MNCWIFQSKIPNFKEYIRGLKKGANSWAANQNGQKMRVGDRVFFWKCGGNAGIYAMGSIVKERYVSKDEYGKYKVKVAVDKDLAERFISRFVFKENKILGRSTIITRAAGTNFLLSHREAAEINKLIKSSDISLVPPAKYNEAFRDILRSVLVKDNNYSIILNEADLKCYLYKKFFDDPLFNKRTKKWTIGGGYRINLLHTEYYRFKTKRSKKGARGRWDIAVLYPDPYPEPWLDRMHVDRKDFMDKRPVMIGCELKFGFYNDKPRDWGQLLKSIENDASVFHLDGPKYGYVVYVHIIESNKKSRLKMEKRKTDILRLFKTIGQDKKQVKLFYVEWDEETGQRSMKLESK